MTTATEESVSTKALIEEFLAQKRLAVVGVSRDPKDFSRTLFHDLRERGYDMVPVNPKAEEIEGLRCFPSITQVEPPVDGALLITGHSGIDEAIRQCEEAGVPRIWLFGIMGKSAAGAEALRLCAEHGIEVINGYCPYLFLPDAAFFHRAHCFFVKLVGKYPK